MYAVSVSGINKENAAERRSAAKCSPPFETGAAAEAARGAYAAGVLKGGQVSLDEAPVAVHQGS
jgi:hypothetical protein